jgi:hypothetical protein
LAKQKKVLLYQGKPLIRKDNTIYYGSMADKYIVMLQVLEPKTATGFLFPPVWEFISNIQILTFARKTVSFARVRKKVCMPLWISLPFGFSVHWTARYNF